MAETVSCKGLTVSTILVRAVQLPSTILHLPGQLAYSCNAYRILTAALALFLKSLSVYSLILILRSFYNHSLPSPLPPPVSRKFSKKISLLFLRFSPEFRCSNISAVTEHTRNQIFFERYTKIFFPKIFTLVLLDT